MSKAYGIGARHFFVTEAPLRNGRLFCEQGKNNNFCLFSRSRAKLYLLREFLNEVWQESKKG